MVFSINAIARLALLGMATGTLALGSRASAQISITNLGALSGGTGSVAYGVNFTGSAVVGDVTLGSDNRGFVWNSGTATAIPLFPGGASSHAQAVSDNGGTAVGYSYFSVADYRAFRWTSSTGTVDLGTLSGGIYSEATGTNIDGSVVVGSSDSTLGERAFRWTAATGMVDLGVLAGGTYSDASGVSADGNVVAGSSNTTTGDHAFVWTSGTGMVDLGVAGGGSWSYANGISRDGSTVIGSAGDAANMPFAFRWTQGTGMVTLGSLAGGAYSYAQGVDHTGTIVVGSSDSSAGTRPYFWTASKGMVELNSYLAGRGVNMTGWDLVNAWAISGDGTSIVGEGWYNGNVTAFQISGLSLNGGAVPEPGEWAAMGILGAGLSGLVLRKRRSPAI